MKKGNDYHVRWWNISLARFVAMTAIIICHMLQFYKNELAFWFNVGVQVFFIISGFLYCMVDIKNPTNFFIKAFKKIYIPYLIFVIALIIVYKLGGGKTGTLISLESVIRLLTCTGTIDGLGHLWFVGYILFCYLITPYLQALKEKVITFRLIGILSTIIIIFVGMTTLFILTESYFEPDKIFCYILGYFICIIYFKYGEKILKKILPWITVFTIILCLLRIYSNYIIIPPLKGHSYITNYSQMILGLFIFISIIYAFSNIKKNKLLDLSDRYSYYIYLTHHIFILGHFSLMDLTNNPLLNIILVLVCTILSAIILSFLSGKIKKIFLERNLRYKLQ